MSDTANPKPSLARYRIVRRLGAGGMGEVFLAQDTELERPVALKVMSAELAKDPNQHKRFRKEAKAASGLSHPHVCVVHEVGETEDGRPFLAMEYIEGQTLDVVAGQRRLKLREIIQVGIEAADALDAAHTRGLVHRDIKPGNLMLDKSGRVKVLDFGLAKWFGADELGALTTSVAHTKTGMLIGTPQYMSPEQALGQELGPRSDLFSLGVVLYELVAGQRPFPGRTVGETINRTINQAPAPLGLENPVFSPALDNIIFKCLEKEPEKRYVSAKELADELRRLKDDSERALATTVHPPTQVTQLPAAPKPTALWKLAARANAGRNTALVWMLGFVVVALLVALLIAGGWALVNRRAAKPPSPGAGAPKTSLAVLPFVNLSGDKADEYLSDGMTEELLNVLARLPGLRVPGRSSSFAFKGRSETGILRAVGEQLNVNTVLEGSVRKSGNRLRITAQLINLADGFQLWSETYDREATDFLSIQSDVAQQVAAALKLELGIADAQRLRQKPTENLEAYHLYLQGRSEWNRRATESLHKAIDLFNAAAAKDSGFALAYAGLADCYVVLPNYQTSSANRETQAKAKAAAMKALELNPQLAAPLAALASLKDDYDWDWTGAEADYRRAIELDPTYPTARQWFAESLSIQGRYAEAVEQARMSVELDPLSRVVNAALADTLRMSGKADDAVELLRKQLAFDPTFGLAHFFLGRALVASGKLDEALVEFEAAGKMGDELALGYVGFCQARTGRTEAARKTLRQLEELQSRGGDLSDHIALLHFALGDRERTYEILEQAAASHSWQLQYITLNPCWDDLRKDPRFQAILRKMNLVK